MLERLTFAHPAYLWGVFAIALPILVHLFNQRRPRPLAFGAIEFVLRSQRQKARRLRLRQIVLLALRRPVRRGSSRTSCWSMPRRAAICPTPR